MIIIGNEKYEKIWVAGLKITNLDNGNYCQKHKDGTEYWCNKDGIPYRLNGPAMIFADGTEEFWFKNGKLIKEI